VILTIFSSIAETNSRIIKRKGRDETDDAATTDAAFFAINSIWRSPGEFGL
jgi:hypothetical protein